jgi:26S proteasome regulatory subunit N2
MKTEDTAAADKHGDVSPLSSSISNLPESTTPPEPNFQKLPNFSRVTPAQMAYVTFPSDSRYQPVRAVSTHQPRKGHATAAALANLEKFGGGGILILVDQHPEQPPEHIEFTTTAAPQGEASRSSVVRHIALDEDAPEADPPPSFEVRS